MSVDVKVFFDRPTFTYSYVVSDPASKHCAIIDSVLDYDQAASKTSTASADAIIDFVTSSNLSVDWILETHVHADHLSAAQYLRERLGGKIAMGAEVTQIQTFFGGFFGAEPEFATDGRQFDHLFADNETFKIGDVEGYVMHTPGHTPACAAYVFPGVCFVGDTIFMPDYGTARCDFPGGDAAQLYWSIRKILSLPMDTKLYMCHDYGTSERKEFAHETTVAAEREANVHINDNVDSAEFIAFRKARDAQLAAPRLLLPSVQFNMRGGALPPADANGVSYFKIPVRS